MDAKQKHLHITAEEISGVLGGYHDALKQTVSVPTLLGHHGEDYAQEQIDSITIRCMQRLARPLDFPRQPGESRADHASAYKALAWKRLAELRGHPRFGAMREVVATHLARLAAEIAGDAARSEVQDLAQRH